MEKVKLKNGKTVGYYLKKFPEGIKAEEDYVILSVMADNLEQIQRLKERKFSFADRCLSMELMIKGWNARMDTGKKQNFVVTTDWNLHTINQIAQNEFIGDCRFAVDFGMNDIILKNELLENFIRLLREKNCMATCCYIDDILIGFNLWNIRNKRGRILLGALNKGYKGTGMAVHLYSHTIQYIQKMGGVFLTDTVFSSNIQAINLHILLSSWGGG